MEKTEKRMRSLKCSIPSTLSPSLVFSYGETNRKQSFFTISDGCYYRRSVPELRRMYCIASSSHGWLLMHSSTTTSCYLFNYFSLQIIHLPPLPAFFSSQRFYGVKTHDPDPNPDGCNNCFVMLVGENNAICLCCGLHPDGCSEWIRLELVTEYEDKEEKFDGTITDVVSCNNNEVYMAACDCDCDGIFIFHVKLHHDLSITPTITRHITDYERTNDVIFMPNGFNHRTNFVESCGDIFQVKREYLGLTQQLETLEVYKLDLLHDVWVKVQTLSDRVFLLGRSSISISATQLGLPGDCIFFYEPTHRTNLYKFDMKDGAITLMRSCPNFRWQWGEPYWLVPTQSQYEKKLLCCPKGGVQHQCCDEPYLLFRNGDLLEKQNQKARYKRELEEEQWSLNDVPIEFIERTMSHLNLGDCIHFRLTCKTWLSITPPLRSVDHLPICASSQFQQPPWLMSFPKNNNSMCTFHHPIYNDTYLMDIPELVGAFVHNSKYGWLLMSTEDSCFFFFNPFTRTTIKLPDLPLPCYRHFVGISFSSPPTSSDCVVFGHHMFGETEINILVHRYGQDEWESFFIENKVPFLAAYCNPVFCDGSFYCLGSDGNLGIFDTKEGLAEEFVWLVVQTNSIVQNVNMTIDQCFIVECEGQILSVFIGHLGNPVCVCILDQSKMEWVKIESLGDKVIYLSHTTSILAVAALKGTENKIFIPMRINVPMFDGKQSVYFSLRTKRYHSFGSKVSSKDWVNTCRPWQGTWIESFCTDLTSMQSQREHNSQAITSISEEEE